MSFNLIYEPIIKTKIRDRSIFFWQERLFKEFSGELNNKVIKLNNYFFYYIKSINRNGLIEIFRNKERECKSINNLIAFINEDKDLKNIDVCEELTDFIKVIPIHEFDDVERVIKKYQMDYYISDGVILEDFSDFYIEGLPKIEEGSVISKGVVIKGYSVIGKNTRIGEYSYIENTKIENNCTILPFCVLRDSVIEGNVTIGPFAHLRNNAVVKRDAKIGNFVEMKKSVLGEGSKSMHLTYIGDATVGKNVNIGAGTITCNYDGEKKNPTFIEDNVFIGSGTELVAPVRVKRNSYIGAGSTITQEVPEDSLAVARARQRNIKGWVERKKEKK